MRTAIQQIVVVLQFGHGGDAVDNFGPGVFRPDALRFNSATAVTPWMTPVADATRRCVASLQFGHGGDAVDDGRQSGDVRVVERLQFGHGGDAVDDLAQVGRVPLDVGASIRPRR